MDNIKFENGSEINSIESSDNIRGIIHKIEIIDYDEEQMGEDYRTSLINNGEIYDNETNELLSIAEIKELQLFINPISAEVFRFYTEDNSFKVDNRYDYQSY